MNKKLTGFLLFLLLGCSVYGQKTDTTNKNYSPFILGLRGNYGNIFAHSQYVESADNTPARGFELDFGWHYNTDEVWGDCHCYPRVGFILNYYDYNARGILGEGYAGALYMQHFFGIPKTINPFLKGGAGLAYLTKPSDPENPHLNMSYATNINFRLYLTLGINYQVTKHIGTNLGVSFNHDSNAGIKEPNGGINFPSVSLGVDYTFNPVEFSPRPYVRTAYDRGERLKRHDITIYGGFSAISFPDSGQYPIYGVAYNRSWQVWRIGAISAGAELEFNGRAKEKNKRYHHKWMDSKRFSVNVGHEFLMGRTMLSIALGAYLYRPIVESDFIYQRYGLVYRVHKNWIAGINFKAYRHTADILDFRVTYTW